MRFKLIGGPHVVGMGANATMYKKGAIIQSDEDLVAKHPNKFELVPEPEKAKAPEEEAAAGEAAPDEEEAPEETGFGMDVTGNFKKAAHADLKVFKKGKFFTVVDADEPDKALNEEELTDKKAVGAFISNYLKG